MGFLMDGGSQSLRGLLGRSGSLRATDVLSNLARLRYGFLWGLGALLAVGHLEAIGPLASLGCLFDIGALRR